MELSDRTRKICIWSILSILSAALSILERPLLSAIPLPLPGFKLGFANICVLFCLYRMGRADSAVVLGLRILLTGLLFGSPISFTLSLAGGLFALSGAFGAYRSKKLSPVGVSVVSSALHVTGQITAASLILRTPGLFTSYLPWLLLLSVPTGILNGVLARVLINQIPSRITQNSTTKRKHQ